MALRYLPGPRFAIVLSHFPGVRGPRDEEFVVCLRSHLENPLIASVVVLDEGVSNESPLGMLLSHAKVTRCSTASRPTFAQLADALRGVIKRNQFGIIANSDVRFDSSLGWILAFGLRGNDMLALSRREADGSVFRAEIGDTQDAWVSRGVPETWQRCSFPIGLPSCDGRIARIFVAEGHRVINPAFRIRMWHEHAEDVRSYTEHDRLPGTCGFVRPTGYLKGQASRALQHFGRNIVPFVVE